MIPVIVLIQIIYSYTMVSTLVLVAILSLVASAIAAPTDATVSIMLSDETGVAACFSLN